MTPADHPLPERLKLDPRGPGLQQQTQWSYSLLSDERHPSYCCTVESDSQESVTAIATALVARYNAGCAATPGRAEVELREELEAIAVRADKAQSSGNSWSTTFVRFGRDIAWDIRQALARAREGAKQP